MIANLAKMKSDEYLFKRKNLKSKINVFTKKTNYGSCPNQTVAYLTGVFHAPLDNYVFKVPYRIVHRVPKFFLLFYYEQFKKLIKISLC